MGKRKRKMAATNKLKRGDKVRVLRGVKDTDYPDLPMGGWAGEVIEVQKDGMYTVRWSKETLAAIHPVFKNRCEKDGLEYDLYSISGDDLEADAGGPLEIEQPTTITTKPLSPKDQDDRIRMILGLTSNDPLPEADSTTHQAYFVHLSKSLAFPFKAEYRPEYGRPVHVKVIGLGDPEDEPMVDETYGMLCEARLERRIVTVPLGDLEGAEGKTNRQLVEDYAYWFHNWG